MATQNGDWKVLKHDPLEKLTENLWRVEGTLPGMSLRRVMTVARMADGRLVFHSAIALEESAMKEIEAWGTPAFLLVPNGYHRLDAPAFKKRYPSLAVLTPKGARKKVEEKLAVDGTYADFPQDTSVSLETLSGVNESEGAMIVHSADGVTVVLNDVMFNMAEKPRDALGWLFTTLFGSGPGPRVSRLFKLAAVKNAKDLRSELDRFAAIPDLRRVVVSHGGVASGPAAAQALKAAAGCL